MMRNYELWAGTYTEGQQRDGVFALDFDGHTLQVRESWGGLQNPSYIQPVKDRVYAVEEQKEGGSVIELTPGQEHYRRYSLPGNGYCHITAHGRFLYASGYVGGCIAGIDMETGQVCCFLEHQGCGPDPVRQKKAHVHSAQPTPDGKSLFVADLGLDKLFQYCVSPNGALTPHQPQPWVQSAPGQGPRHFAYHPNGRYVYLVTELAQTLRVYGYSPENSTLTYHAEYPLYTGAPVKGDLAADIHVSQDGAFVYASVRGQDVIFCYRISENPADLTLVGTYSSGGNGPRSIHLSPDGRFLAAANQLTNNVCVFPLDSKTGALQNMAAEISLPAAVCVKWRNTIE